MQVLPAVCPAAEPATGTASSTTGSTTDSSSDGASSADATFLELLGAALAELVDVEAGGGFAVEDDAEEPAEEPAEGELAGLAVPLLAELPAAVTAVAADAKTEAATADGSEPAAVEFGSTPEGTIADGPDLAAVAAGSHIGETDGAGLGGATAGTTVDSSTAASDGTNVGPAEPDSTGAAGELRVPGWVAVSDDTSIEQPGARDVAGPAAVAPSAQTTAAPATEVAAPASGPSTAEPLLADGDDPWEQLATVVRPLRQLSDGSHRLSLQLRPAELGVVHLEVALEDGVLSLRALAENLATRDVLAASLPDLRAELARSGIDLGSLEVGDHTFGAGHEGGSPDADAAPTFAPLAGAADHTGSAGLPQPSAEVRPSPTAGSSRLDLSL